MKSVSFVFQWALKKPGIAAQIAPAAMLDTIMQRMIAQLGSTFRRQIMHAAHASAPASTCPSAPMFQKRILNAGVTASEMHSSTARFWNSTHVLRAVPKPPSRMAA